MKLDAKKRVVYEVSCLDDVPVDPHTWLTLHVLHNQNIVWSRASCVHVKGGRKDVFAFTLHSR